MAIKPQPHLAMTPERIRKLKEIVGELYPEVDPDNITGYWFPDVESYDVLIILKDRSCLSCTWLQWVELCKKFNFSLS